MDTDAGVARDRSRSSTWALAIGTAVVWLGVVLVVQMPSRVFASWHGFLHTAIALRFPTDTLPPENPFFAGEPVHYYYVYHALARGLGAVLGTDLLHAFQLITFAGLAVLVVCGVGLGARRLGSAIAGVAIGVFVLVGSNPFGPLIAFVNWLRGATLWAPAPSDVETVFVSNALADQLMTHPLLGAMYVSGDWRQGQNLVWFLDISSRGLALACLVALLLVLSGSRGPRWLRLVGVFLVAFVVAALNALVGLAAAGALLAVAVLVRVFDRSTPILPFAMAFLGAVAAFPLFHQMLAAGESLTIMPFANVVSRTVNLTANLIVLAPLAVIGALVSKPPMRGILVVMAGAGLLLVAPWPIVRLAEGNEHNIINAAQVLLAIPAAAVVAAFGSLRARRRALVVSCALFLPMTAGTLAAYTGRPPIPLGFDGRHLTRSPSDEPLASLYRWIREETDPRAVFVIDPAEPIKMSGNVSELPAMTGRTLFIDHESYLTEVYPDADRRRRIATSLLEGALLSNSDAAYLRALDRPVYVVTHEADSAPLSSRLRARWGSAAFRSGRYAVFRVVDEGLAAALPAPLDVDVDWMQYIGGSDGGQLRDIAVDVEGNVYAVGGTRSTAFATTPGAFQPEPGTTGPSPDGSDRYDAFVVKYAPDGTVLWSSYLGGPAYDRAYAVSVGPDGYPVVAGRAGVGFPVTAGAAQATFAGGREAAFYGPQDGFVCKLMPDGSAIVFCSYFGTDDANPVRDVAVDSRGSIYLASGWTSGTHAEAMSSALLNRPAGDTEALIVKLLPDGSAAEWARFVGGSRWESHQNSVVVDGNDDPLFLFTTESADAPASSGAYDTTYAGEQDVFLAKLDGSTGDLLWGTYVGASQNESTETHELAVGPDGSATVVGPTMSLDFPATPDAYQPVYGGGRNDIFMATIDSEGELVAATFVGGLGWDRPEGITVDGSGRPILTGTTTSVDFPVTAGAAYTSLPGERSSFVLVLSPRLDRLEYATYLGGTGIEFGRGAAHFQDRIYVGGETSSQDFVGAHGSDGEDIAAYIVGLTQRPSGRQE